MTEAPAQHAKAPRSRGARILRLIAIGLAVVLVAGGSVTAITVWSLFGNIHKVDIGNGSTHYDIGKMSGGFNVLIVGSDQCLQGDDCKNIGVREAALNDVTMLLHVSEDQQHAVAVSIPRDLIVPIPSCPKEDGSGSYSAMSAQQINTTLSYGGLACTVLTVEALSGVDIQFAGLITFQGVIAMSDAVGGVPVCLTGDLNDTYTNLHLTKGTHVLKGKEALQFLRSRHAVGNGSDLTRITSQQVYLSSLVRTLRSADTLGDPLKVYNLAVAATKNMQLSTQLASADTLVSIALTLKDIPLENIVFTQEPTVADPANANRVIPDAAAAATMWGYVNDDVAFAVSGSNGGSVVDPSATATATGTPPSTATSTATATGTPTPAPTLDIPGQSAITPTCAVTR
jgi:LCP family protein required for cell wall assembly